jgi:hypothetical protein
MGRQSRISTNIVAFRTKERIGQIPSLKIQPLHRDAQYINGEGGIFRQACDSYKYINKTDVREKI